MLFANLSSGVVQSFLEARTKMHFVVIEVVDGDHFSGFAVDFTFERTTVCGVDPILDDRAVVLFDEEMPAFNVEHSFLANIILGEIALFDFVGKGLEWGEVLAERFKLPFNIIGPSLSVRAVVPVHSGLDVPEAVDTLSVVECLFVAMFHIGLVELRAFVSYRDEEVVNRRDEFVNACESLCRGFYWNHRDIFMGIRVDNGEICHIDSVSGIAFGSDAAVTDSFCNDLDTFPVID